MRSPRTTVLVLLVTLLALFSVGQAAGFATITDRLFSEVYASQTNCLNDTPANVTQACGTINDTLNSINQRITSREMGNLGYTVVENWRIEGDSYTASYMNFSTSHVCLVGFQPQYRVDRTVYIVTCAYIEDL